MRICYLGNANSVHVQRWASHFAGKRHEVHILSAREPSIELKRVQVHRVGATRLKPLSDLAALIQSRRLLKSLRPDLVHAYYLTDYGFLGALANCHPLLISVLGSDILREPEASRLKRLAVRYFLKKADAFTCTSRYLYSATLKYAPRAARSETIAFGIDTGLFQPTVKRAGSVKVLGTLKHLSRICGVEYLLRALPDILKRQMDVKVLIAGGGEQKEYRALAKTLGIEGVVEFLGDIPHSAVPDYLGKLDIFVQPSLSESFGVAILEAQAMEIPVVASNVGGIPEVVENGETGLLVEARDSGALAEAILRLLGDEALCHRMGAKGRAFVEESYTWAANADRMEALYLELLEQRRRR